jgi:hypothetical protein
VAAIFFATTVFVHVSTFFPIDPMDRWPGVMLLHVAVFPPFIAAIYFAKRADRTQSKDAGLDPVMNATPKWMPRLLKGLFAYAIFNFGMFLTLNEGGGPHEKDGKYVLSSHGRVIRELTEHEYHRQRAYVVRGFSGHWMMFAYASLTFMVGSARLRHRGPAATETPPEGNEDDDGGAQWPPLSNC